MAKFTQDELISQIKNYTNKAETAAKTISKEREQALDYYNQEPLGDEREGFSTFVSSDVRDTIEWILPNLIEMFIGNGNPVTFRPVGENDIDAAKQESRYVNYIYNVENNGFLNTYTWFKDALIQKNGIIKAFWDEGVEVKKEEYCNQNAVELQALNQDPELTIDKVEIMIGDERVEETDPRLIITPPELVTYEVYATRERQIAKVTIKPVAPENFLIESDYNSLDLSECNFCREDAFVTRSELIADGYSKKVVDSIPTFGSKINSSEEQSRYWKEGGISDNDFNEKVKVSDIFIRVDTNGDGMAELRFVKLANDTVVLENEEVDSIHYFAITPNIMTHKFYGMSIADSVADLQKLYSTLMRQTLNSLYFANEPRMAVLKDQVEMDDLLYSNGAGSIVRERIPNAVRPLITPFVGAQTLPMFDLISKMREERTGVSQVTQGLDPAALSDSTNLVGTLVMNAAMGRIKMIARIFAETGFKALMSHIHGLVSKNERNSKQIEFSDGNFVFVKPTEWRERRNLQVNVGIGFAERKERTMSLERILNLQQQIFAAQQGEGALLNAQNVYNAIQDLLEQTGLDTRNRYFSNPKEFTPPPPPEDPNLKTLEIAQAEVAAKTEQAASEYQLKIKKHNDEMRLKEIELKQKGDLEREKMLLDAELTREGYLNNLQKQRIQ